MSCSSAETHRAAVAVAVHSAMADAIRAVKESIPVWEDARGWHVVSLSDVVAVLHRVEHERTS